MKKKKVYKNRDSKDLNDNYTFVKLENLKEFKGTHEEFLSKITHLKPGYLKKENGRIITHLWWEDKDMWFMNHGEQRIISERKSNFTSYGWFIEKDMLGILKSMIRQDNLIMYFKK
jgi:hypothetical protein